MKSALVQRVLQLKITLRGIRPPIWRRVLVSETATLHNLHATIQALFGWLDYHLHQFEVGGVLYADPKSDELGESNYRDDATTKLQNLHLRRGQSFLYRYDFGDDWGHNVLVEELLSQERRMRLPCCTGGKRAGPPEDVGGVGGYTRFLQAISNPANDEHDEYLEWVGGAFDPDFFDLEATDRDLRRRTQPEWNGEQPIFADDAWEEPTKPLQVPARAALLGEELTASCQMLVLRRDVVTTLEYLRDNKVSGTQSTGNFPRKAVQEIVARLVDPPRLEERIGDYVYRFQSEDDVQPVYFVHALANGARLIDGGPARRWKLTPAGEQFLQAGPVEQVWALFAAWWYRINWLVAVSMAGEGEEVPEEFPPAIVTGLRAASPEDWVGFALFAQGVLGAAGWKSSAGVAESTWNYLIRIVELAVIEPCERFGLLECKRETESRRWGEIEKLSSFRVTPLGSAFFASLV